MGIEIKRLTETDAAALWEFRLRALTEEPQAFAESAEEHVKKTVEATAEGLRRGGDESFVLGAIRDSALVGMVGFFRETRLKRRHRGWVWGMYVAGSERGRGTGKKLMEELIRRAREIPGLERILLSVLAGQSAARRLYEGCGFVVFGREPEALMVDGRFYDEEQMSLKVGSE